MKNKPRNRLLAYVLLLIPSTGATPPSVFDESFADTPDPICVTQGTNSCQGVFRCDNSSLGTTGCVFWVYDSACKFMHPGDPWPGVRAGDSLSFAGLEHEVQIRSVTNDLDKDNIEIVFQYVDGWFGEGKSQYVRGDCSGPTVKCAFMRAAFTCK